MKKRCFNCKKLEDESTIKFYKRTKINLDAVFLCKACKKKKEPCERKVYVRKSHKLSDEECEKIEHERQVAEGRKKRHMFNYGFVKNDIPESACEGNRENKFSSIIYPHLRN